MDENTFKKQIEEQLRNKIRGYLQGGCFWSINHDLTTGIVIDNIEQVMEELVQIASQHSKLTNYRYDNNKSETDNVGEINKIIEQNIERDIGVLTYAISTRKTEEVTFMSQPIKLNVVMFTKLQNGKIIEREFGTKENWQQYTPEEIKVILKEAEEIETGKKFKDDRYDKFTFLSMIVDMNDKLIGENSKNPIRFITPDNNNKEEVYKEICNVVKQAKQDPNSPNILLIPYSANGHIVTLLVDKRKVTIDDAGEVLFNKDSIMCFDSSHYFTFNSEHWYTIPGSFLRLGLKYILDHNTPRRSLLALVGGVGTLWLTSNPFISTTTLASLVCTDVAINNSDIMDKPLLNGNFINKYFYNALYNCMIKKPINDKMIQGLKGTCSFYTEAFCYLVSKYIQDKKNEGMDLNLNDISNHINSKEFIKQLKDKKEEFFNEYKATMKEVEQKQEQQSISKTQDVTANKEISQQVSNTSTPTVTEESPSNSQFPSHSTTPSKTNSTQSISSSSPTTEHLQTLQQQVSVQSQNSQSPQTQSEPPTLVEGMRNIVGSTLTNSGATSMEGSHTPTTSQMSGTSSLSKSPGPSTPN